MTSTQTWLAHLIASQTVSDQTNLPLMAGVEQAQTALGADCTRFSDAAGQKAALLTRLSRHTGRVDAVGRCRSGADS
ncbi:MAG: hypothetical protein ACK4VZ_10380 [Paracoccaceae bacterium]